MRYAIVSDIHANLAAWKTVLTDIADMKADKIICLGDVTGYGPNPVEVLESVYRVVHVTLMGNHDAAVCGIVNPETFSPRAKAAVLLHRELISPTGMAWLRALPLVLNAPGFNCAHGDLADPAAFRYIIDAKEALPSWAATREQLMFVGHSHLAGVYVIGASGIPHFVEPCDFELEPGKRYVINPGSVGYPRVGECRSSYCLFDDEAKTITFRKLPFDSDGYSQALKAAGMGCDLWMQRKEAQRHHVPWLRERLTFGKPSVAQHHQDRNEHARLSPQRGNRSVLRALLGLAACATLAAGAAVAVAHRSAPKETLAIAVPEFDLPSLNAYPIIPSDKNLLPALTATLGADGQMAGWRYAFEDRTRQSFSTALRDGGLLLCIRNAGPCRAQLESPLINLAGTGLRALRLRGRICKSEDFSGTVFYQLVTYIQQPDGALKQSATLSHEVRGSKAKSPFSSLSRKLELGKNVSHVRFRVDAAFSGTLEIEQPQLCALPPQAKSSKEPAE